MATEDDIRLQQLMDREIPSSRQALKDSHRNLAELASYCEANYVDCTDKATALEETKKYAIQSLASVAYQINMLATNVMQMLEIQTEQLGHMESNLNHLDQSVGNYKENVARRKVGSLAISKHLTKTPLKVAAPLEPEKPQRYKRVPIDYGILDDIGHGVKPNNDVGRLFQGGRRESNTSLRIRVWYEPRMKLYMHQMLMRRGFLC
ncbi:abl interactor 1-like isoform X1 [Corticium candelabrum]|uniref:abl interactor 1-like isoform X1 n=1 Tax=Corticium candelabrum TaxID=121492 RepID=UPI002E270BAA|nr:abl interactor 1-like isoform X1 [Corticium candelabrum]